MFERRIKILLGTLAFFIALLLARAGWLQVVQGSDWEKNALETGRHSSWLETSRGRILDFKDHVVAEDAACIDAAVDYRAIDPDAKESQEWLKVQAKTRLQARGVFKGDRDDRSRLIDAEVDRIKEDLKFLWGKLAQVSGKTPEEIDEIN